MAQTANDTAGVIARPPLLLLGAMILGAALDWAAPFSLFDAAPALARWMIGALFFLGAFLLVRAAMGRFGRAGTPVQTGRMTSALVTEGVYAHVRNPIYSGFLLLVAGFASITAGEWLALAGVALLLVIHFGVVLREERYLADRFGADYAAYKARVPRYGWRF